MPIITDDVMRCDCGKELISIETHELVCEECEPVKQLGYDELYDAAYELYISDTISGMMRALLKLLDMFAEAYDDGT